MIQAYPESRDPERHSALLQLNIDDGREQYLYELKGFTNVNILACK